MTKNDSAESGAHKPGAALRAAEARPPGSRASRSRPDGSRPGGSRRPDSRAAGSRPPAQAGSADQSGAPTAPCPDRRKLSRLVPNIAGLLCMLIGISDILEVIAPDYRERLRRLHRFTSVVPGSQLAVTATAIAITGL